MRRSTMASLFLLVVFLSASIANAKGASKLKLYYKVNADADMALQFGRTGVGHALDANMTLGASWKDQVAAELYLTLTTGDDLDLPSGGDFTRVGEKWDPTFTFDGAAIIVNNLFKVLSLKIFDYTLESEKLNYYYYKNQDIIIPGSYPRGLDMSLTLGQHFTLRGGFGVDDSDDKDEYLGHVFFSLGLDREISIANLYFGISQFQGSDDPEWIALGLDIPFLNIFRGTLGMLMPVGGKPFAIHGGIEGSFGEKFLLAYALLGGNDVKTRLDLSERFIDQVMIYLEPGYAFNKYVSMGISLEYHRYGPNLNDGERSDQFWFVPGFYFYPTGHSKQMEVWIWYRGMTKRERSGYEHWMGLETIFNF